MSEIYEGNSITVNNINKSKAKIKNRGGSRQATRSGKNKLKITATTQTINGVEFTVNQDGTIIANGTATGLAQISLGKPIVGTYYYSGCPSRRRLYRFI